VEILAVMLTVGLRNEAPDDDAALTDALNKSVIMPAFADLSVRPGSGTRISISRAAPISSGGPTAHAGLTGRKTAVDAYGGYSRQGTAAFSGKDPSRIDRTAAYAARHAAKCLVAAGLADECEVQLSYAIGERDAISIEIDTYGTGKMRDEKLKARLAASFDFTAAGIAERLGLWSIAAERKGRFWRQLACYGHMGRTDIDAPWERTSEAAQLA
jgi:S-adenosylmethionine synthetase